MSFFPSDFNPRDDVIGLLDLCEVDTASGTTRFMLGSDGKFIDSDGNEWWGSQLINVGSMQTSIGGEAPEGSMSLSYFQDPDADDLIDQLREHDIDNIDGEAIRFYVQPIRSMAEFYAPTTPPVLWTTRTSRTVTFAASGAQSRSITLGFESWTENRRAARRLVMNTEGHAKLIGEANPSFEFMPTSDFTEEKLFG